MKKTQTIDLLGTSSKSQEQLGYEQTKQQEYDRIRKQHAQEPKAQAKNDEGWDKDTFIGLFTAIGLFVLMVVLLGPLFGTIAFFVLFFIISAMGANMGGGGTTGSSGSSGSASGASSGSSPGRTAISNGNGRSVMKR